MATGIITNTKRKKAKYFTENINGVELDMILIPSGSFTMGAEKEEEGSRDDERPTHQVTIAKPFFMGRYPITQEQWRAVTKLPQIKRELKENPSNFKGSDRLPVESVSWYDTVEFCARLTKHTRKNYRLPSEAQWEYACRAGTTTPFHFGETISTDIANYDGTDEKDGAYGKGEKGERRAKTTEVVFFKNANEFGLSEMHGNVWEWCADPWHSDYINAPNDGRVWDEKAKEDFYDNYLDAIDILLESGSAHIMRGGSWYYDPRRCRSAYRGSDYLDWDRFNYGFRVVCG